MKIKFIIKCIGLAIVASVLTKSMADYMMLYFGLLLISETINP